MNIIGQQLFSKALQYLQSPWMLPSGSIGLPQVLSHLKVLVNPLVTMFTVYSTLKCLLNVVYHVQQATPIHGCCLPSTTIPLVYRLLPSNVAASSYCYILVVTFLWQLIAYYSRSYHMVCLLALYSIRNVTLPWKG